MAQKEGRHFRFGKYEFWAERGMISLVDTEAAGDSDGGQSHWRIMPGEYMKRAIAAYMQEPDKYADKLRKLRQLLEDARTACKQAKAQGDPSDPSVIDHIVRHTRKSSALVMPHELPPMPGQRLKIRQKGHTPADTLRDGFNVSPDLTIGQADMITPARAALMRRAAPPRRR